MCGTFCFDFYFIFLLGLYYTKFNYVYEKPTCICVDCLLFEFGFCVQWSISDSMKTYVQVFIIRLKSTHSLFEKNDLRVLGAARLVSGLYMLLHLSRVIFLLVLDRTS